MARDVGRGSHRSGSLETGQLAEGKAYGASQFYERGSPGRDVVQQVSGSYKSLRRRGGEVQGQLVGRMVLDQTPSPKAEGRARGGARLAKKGSRKVILKRHPDLF